MGNWKKMHIRLPQTKEGRSVKARFEKTSDLEIVKITPSCNCFSAKLKGDFLTVNYTAETVPVHLVKRGYFEPTKSIAVRYSDGHTDLLSFSIIVTKN